MSNVRALAAGAITLFTGGAGRPRGGRRTNRGGSQRRLSAQLARSVRLGALLKRRAHPGLRQPRCRLRAKCMALARREQSRLPQTCRVARGTTGVALKFNSMQTHVYRSGTHHRVKSAVGRRLRQAPSAASGGVLAASENERPNPSIEGTSNIWLRQLSAAPHVKR